MIFFVANFIRWLILTRKRYRLIGYIIVKDKNRALPILLPLFTVNRIGNDAHSIDKKLATNRVFYSI
jgi:hypothetical protein